MESIIGGFIIGGAVSIMLLFNGRVTGISGIVGGILNPKISDKRWRLLFLAGLICGGFILKYFHSSSFSLISNATPLDYIGAGFLVGFGTLLGNGCTSGHGVCGISRFSIRSIISTLIFITSGIIGVILFKLLRGNL
jgi:uncharacterized membrane protein YedE/YeeE